MTNNEMPWLRIAGVSKQFGAVKALDDIHLDVRKGEFVCLLGPSGCGKTTLLRIIAGLELQDAGSLVMAGRDISRLPPAQRNYGIVFQSYALFPNLTVAQNIGYALRTGRAEKDRRIDELLDLIGLADTRDRYPAQLSGGQQQRVALARALATSPSLLLLDEPLSALDAKVRERLRQELRKLQRKLGVTTVMVTHDQDEALEIADTMVVMSQGRVEQSGSSEQIYRHPASRFVADFIGRANWLPLQRGVEGHALLGGQALALHLAAERATLFCRPEDVRIEAHWQTGTAALLAVVDAVEFHRGMRRATLSLCADRSVSIVADVGPNDAAYVTLEVGRQVPLTLPPDKMQLFAPVEP